jgi:hypothetical protein
MLVKHIHSYALERLKYVTILLVIIGSLFGALASYSITNKGSESSYKTEAQALQGQLNEIKNLIVQSDFAIGEWDQTVKKVHMLREGIQVDFIKVLIKKLEEKHRVKGMNITLSTPELRSDFSEAKFVNVQMSNLSLVFMTYTDIDAYNFISDLQKELPGYVQVKTLSIIGVNEISEEIIRGLQTGDTRDIVSVKVDLLWQDFQDKPEIAEELKAKKIATTPASSTPTTAAPTTPAVNPTLVP